MIYIFKMAPFRFESVSSDINFNSMKATIDEWRFILVVYCEGVNFA